MSVSRISLWALALAVVVGCAPNAPTPTTQAKAGSGVGANSIFVELGNAPPLNMNSTPVAGPSEAWGKGAEFAAAGESVRIYLPPEGPYTTENTGDSASPFDETSTPIAVERPVGAGIGEHDVWFASQPIRFGDEMFKVVEIASDGSSISFEKSDAKLAGLIVGRTVPELGFTSLEGKPITPVAGKLNLYQVFSYG